MIGVGAFVYATAHILLYVVEERFDLVKVASEIVKRLYLTIGLIAWLGLLALAVTSTDAMVKRLGALKWRRLHQAIYVIGMLALIHFFQQTKADFTLPATITGLFGWLICYRVVAARVRGGELSTLALFVLTLAVALLTFLVEAVGIGLWYRASPLRVLQTAFDFDLADPPGLVRAGRRSRGRAGRSGAVAHAGRTPGPRHSTRRRPEFHSRAGGTSLVPRQRA